MIKLGDIIYEPKAVLSDSEHELKLMLDEELSNLVQWLNEGSMSPNDVLDSLEDLLDLYHNKG